MIYSPYFFVLFPFSDLSLPKDFFLLSLQSLGRAQGGLLSLGRVGLGVSSDVYMVCQTALDVDLHLNSLHERSWTP